MIPQLRFPEFVEMWNSKKLEEICNFQQGVQVDLDLQIQEPKENYVRFLRIENYTQNSQDFRYIPERFSNGKFITADEVAIVRYGATAGFISRGLNGVLANNLFKVTPNKDISNDFLFLLLTDYRAFKFFQSEMAGGAMPALSFSIVKVLKINYPTPPEQTRIATFIRAIDKRINLLQKKKFELEQYKKGVMLSLFSQAIRFKKDDGSDFPDWEEKMLGDLGETYNGLTGKTKVDFGAGKPYIQYMQIFSDSKIDTSKFGFVNIEQGENQNSAQYGDVFFTTSSETPNEIGTSSVLTEQVEEVYLNSFCFGYRPNSLDELVPVFSQFFFRSDNVRKEIVKLAQGSTRFNMSKVEFIKLIFDFPKKEEQIKIANFLLSLDKSIEKLSNQIDDTVVFKQGLLQKMFV